jgi:hypothetical protein
LSNKFPLTLVGAPGTSSEAVKVHKISNVNDPPGWIEVVGVDSSYRPPPERVAKPAACFYVLAKVCSKTINPDYYRAVYLPYRTVGNLISSIAAKCGVDASLVQHTLHVNSKALQTVVDDKAVQQLPEGQHMTVEFNEINLKTDVNEERDALTLGPITMDRTVRSGGPKALEMMLIF